MFSKLVLQFNDHLVLNVYFILFIFRVMTKQSTKSTKSRFLKQLTEINYIYE